MLLKPTRDVARTHTHTYAYTYTHRFIHMHTEQVHGLRTTEYRVQRLSRFFVERNVRQIIFIYETSMFLLYLLRK